MVRGCAVLSVLFGILFLWGCSDTAPVILDVRATLIREYDSGGRARQRLVVFAEDNNGGIRVKLLRVSHSESGFVWTMPAYSEAYGSRYLVKDHSWSGAGTLYPPRDEYFPEGSYELLWTDLAGREVSVDFVIGAEEASRTGGGITAALPVLSISDNRWSLAPQSDYFSIRYLLCFNAEDELLFMDTYEKFPASVLALREKYPESAYVRAYGANKKGTAGLLLSPVDLP
ncbi:MAG: hypothetical protein LBU99_05030 [Spirochaetaceae bacterium]|jgi:hypothetical protein|nr:hypothetical protein [Spirochaetaceae bacterium]